MFNKNREPNPYNGYENMQLNRIYYEIEEITRKLRNLNNRLHRLESFLGLEAENHKE